MISGLYQHMDGALGNNADLMTEVQMFWIAPALHIPLLDEYDISYIAVAVLRWLQVRPILSLPTSSFKLVPNDRLPCFRSSMSHQTTWYHYGNPMSENII